MRDNEVRYAEFLRIIDGDTFQARIHLATKVRPRVEMVASIRTNNWSAAELNEPEGAFMRDKFENLLRNADRIDVQMRTMSFERIVCSVWLDGELFAGILAHELLSFRRANASDTGIAGGTSEPARSGDDATASGPDGTDDGSDR